ncbi:MAG: helix-turn-helix domain-containing protein [Bacteroidota bacterium]|nr:helix-turn-helix domain-containing protein [Bacteroidota bacterium]
MEKTVHLLIMYTMLVLTLVLFHKGRKHPPSLMLAIYASVEVLTNGLNSLTLSGGYSFFDQFPVLHFIYKPLYCLWVPLFYFYVRYSFSSDFKLNKKHLIHLIPFFAFLVFFLMIWILKGNHYIWENLYQSNTFLNNTAFAVDLTVKVQYLIYNFLMMRSLFYIEKNENLQHQIIPSLGVDIRWLRFIVYGYALACLIGIAITVSVLVKSPAVSVINLVSISYFFLFFFAIFYHTITNKRFSDEVKPKLVQLPNADMKLLMKRIEELVAEKKMYLEPELTLQQIATALNEKERNISQAINTIQQRNLNDYINSLRIEHACGLLLTNKEKPVFEVMYESGFNTKGAFNLAFKKMVGKTPTQYREG